MMRPMAVFKDGCEDMDSERGLGRRRVGQRGKALSESPPLASESLVTGEAHY